MKLLFVCLGNICRSPTAHAVFRQLAAEQHSHCVVDSAGTGAAKGNPPDPRSVRAAQSYSFKGLYSRPITQADFSEFDLIIAMDHQNLEHLRQMCPKIYQAKLQLLMQYHPDFDTNPEVPDPYYGGSRGFDLVFQMIETSCRNLLAQIPRAPHSQ